MTALGTGVKKAAAAVRSASPRPKAPPTRRGEPAPAPTSAAEPDPALAAANTQDIRLAVVLNGGVSLAVWISGVVLELHRLVQASRRRTGRESDPYAGLLDVLDATARIDVIAGTSAGGLNGGFLSLGVVHGCDLEKMRDLWRTQGDLSALLRDPREAGAPSLLRGEYFFERLAEAYDDVFASRGTGVPAPKSDGLPDEPVELYLTGTLWRGRRTPFADDMGRRIVEVDYDATFQFSSDPELVGPSGPGNLEQEAVARQLAVASRCTSSFPGAFEPYEVTVESTRRHDRWHSDAGLANFADTQYVVDGGVLLNKPIRPAIDAVYRQSATNQVRRVLAYVVPDPGEHKPEHKDKHEDEGAPRAHEVLLGVLARLRSTDSVSAELGEIERRNEDVRQRRRTRDRLATALLRAGAAGGDAALVVSAYPSYREVRQDSATRTIARLMVKRGDNGRWSRREIATVLREIAADDGFQFVPQGELEAALEADPATWRWGQSAVSRLGDMTLDVLRRAVWLASNGSPERAAVVAARGQVHGTLKTIREHRRALNATWEAAVLPERPDGVVADEAALQDLRTHLVDALDDWEQNSGVSPRTLHEQALALAAALHGVAPHLREIAAASVAVDRNGVERERFDALVDVLLKGDTPEEVLRCMLRLEVLHVAFAGVSPEPEQEVELVQVSSATPDLLTGIQEHHFGAFYRSSWRVNDWMRGRLDGATQLVQMLLAPERLRQCGMTAVDDAMERLRPLAVGPGGSPAHGELLASWEKDEERIRTELQPLEDDGELPRTFPLVASKIAQRLHVAILETELPELAAAIEAEPDSVEQSDRWAASVRRAFAGPRVPVRRLIQLGGLSGVVGGQRIRREMVEGTDTFARTASHGAAAFTAVVSGISKQKQVAAVLGSMRGYALLVWLLVGTLASRSWFGTHVVAVVIGVGGALIGLALLVPGLPAVVPLVGAVLVLGAASASALTRRTAIDKPPRLRLVLAALVAALALLGSVVARALTDGVEDDEPVLEQLVGVAGGGLGKVLVVFAIVGVGMWLGGARPPRGATKPAPPRATQRNRRLATMVAALVAVVVVGLLMVPDGRTMTAQRDPTGTSYGIVPFELAGSQEVGTILQAWGDEGQAAAQRQIVIDFVWLAAYATFLALACLLLGTWLRKSWHRAGRAAAVAAVLAGGCDAVENVALLAVLGGADRGNADLARTFALAKFALLAAVALFLLAALLRAAWLLWHGHMPAGATGAGTQQTGAATAPPVPRTPTTSKTVPPTPHART